MNKMITACGLALLLPVTVVADEALLNMELNGLDIDSRIINTDATRGPDATGVDRVQVTNNSDVEVICQLKPAAEEPNIKPSQPTIIAPGEQGALRLQGSYRDVKSQATLSCLPN